MGLGLVTHLIAGGLGAAAGATAGVAITAAIKDVQKDWAVASVEGIKQGEAEEIKKSFVPILNSLGDFFQEAGSQVLKDEFMLYANNLCLPLESGNDYVKIPQLRSSYNKRDEDILGTRQAQFEYFDTYYKLKKGGMDKYVAQVRILDNLHTLILNYIDMIKKQPGEKYTNTLEKLGLALDNLHQNFRNIIAQDRTFTLLNKVDQTKRDELIEKIEKNDKSLIKEALAEQKQLSLVESCNQAINNEVRTVEKMAAFFTRALDNNANKTDGDLVIAKMEEGKVEAGLGFKGDVFVVSPIGDLAAHHLKQTAHYKREEVTDKKNSFNERFQRGDFDVSVRTPNGIQNNVLPEYMRTGVFGGFLNSDVVVSPEDMVRIAKIFNYMNIVIALEEDMRHKVDSYGSKGIVSTGEFELRRVIVESFFKKAMDEFKDLTSTHLYFSRFLSNFADSEFLRTNQAALAETNQGSIALKTVPEILRDFIPAEINQIAGLRPVTELEGVAAEAGKVDSIHKEIVHYVEARRHEAGPTVSAIPLNSDEFLYNMALICAHDAGMKDVLISQLVDAKNKLPQTEKSQIVVYDEKLKTLVGAIDEFQIIKAMSENIYLRFEQIKEVVIGINPEVFKFSNLESPESFRKMIEDLDKQVEILDAYARKNSNFKDAVKTISGLSVALGDFRNKLVQQKSLQAGFELQNEMGELVEAKSESARLKSEFEEQKTQSNKLVQGLELQLESQQQASAAEIALLKSQLQSKQAQNENLMQQKAELEKVQEIQQQQINTLETAVQTGAKDNLIIQEKLKETEAFTLNIIENQNNLLNKFIVPAMTKLRGSIERLRSETFSLAHKEGRDELLRQLEDVVNEEIKNMSQLLKDMEDEIQRINIPLDVSEQVREKYAGLKQLLTIQKSSFDDSISKVNELKNQVKQLLQQIEALKEEQVKQAIEQKKKEASLKEEADAANLRYENLMASLEKNKKQDEQATKLKSEKDIVSDPVLNFMRMIIKHAESREYGGDKFRALKQIVDLMEVNRHSAKSTQELVPLIKDNLNAFLIICMQKRKLTFFKGETNTGAYAIRLLNQNADLKKYIKEENKAAFAYADLAKELSGVKKAVNLAKSELKKSGEELTVQKYRP